MQSIREKNMGWRQCATAGLGFVAMIAGIMATMTVAVGQEMSDAEALRLAERVQENLVEVVARVMPAYVRIGGGSGILISPDGYVVTNHHVAEEKCFNVTIGTGKAYRAINVGHDQRGDIVLMKLETDEPLPYVEIGDSDHVRVGQWVVALGNPFLYAFDDAKPTVTMGVVSAVHRFQQGYSDCIQTDARVNPGNSGGPLLSMDGKLIGINGRIAVRRTFGTRINTGIGYAIPSNQIMRFVREWRQRGGLIRHGLINGLAIASSPTQNRGARVATIAVGTDAAAAGFRVGDLITQINGLPVTSRNRYWGILGTFPAGTELDVIVERDGQLVRLSVPLAPTPTMNQAVEIPEPPQGPYVRPVLPALEVPRSVPGSGYLGLTVDLQVDAQVRGCRVFRVLPDTPAQQSGLIPGDIIETIDGVLIENFDALRQFMQTRGAGDTLDIVYRRDGRLQATRLTLTDRPR